MSAITLPSSSQLPVPSQELLATLQRRQGRVPNMLLVLGHSPAALAGYLQLAEQLAGGGLNAAERERVALAVSQANACDYCLRAHTWPAGRQGLSSEEQALARQAGEGDALAQFARALVEGRGRVEDEVFAQARRVGLDEARMVEVVAQVACMTLSNYLNNLAQTEIDFPA